MLYAWTGDAVLKFSFLNITIEYVCVDKVILHYFNRDNKFSTKNSYQLALILMLSLTYHLKLLPDHMSRDVRKLDFCICENKDADQRLCFRFTDSIIPLLPKSEISSP